MRYYVLLALSICLNSASLLLLKKGALIEKDYGLNLKSLDTWLHFLSNGYIYLSLVAFGLATLTWLLALSKIDLSIAYPCVSISYIIIAAASYYFFGETIPLNRWTGIGMITAGVAVMFIK